MRNSHETVSPFPCTRLFCKCDQAECEPCEADAIKGIPGCNPPPHHHHGVLADFPAVFFNLHQRYLSLKNLHSKSQLRRAIN